MFPCLPIFDEANVRNGNAKFGGNGWVGARVGANSQDFVGSEFSQRPAFASRVASFGKHVGVITGFGVEKQMIRLDTSRHIAVVTDAKPIAGASMGLPCPDMGKTFNAANRHYAIAFSVGLGLPDQAAIGISDRMMREAVSYRCMASEAAFSHAYPYSMAGASV